MKTKVCPKCNIGKHIWSVVEYINHCKKVAGVNNV